MSLERHAFHFTTQQGMRRNKGQGHKKAKTVDEFEGGEVPSQQIKKDVVEVGVHDAKLWRQEL